LLLDVSKVVVSNHSFLRFSFKPTPRHTMGKIQFGSEVYTWFIQSAGKGYSNKRNCLIRRHAGSTYARLKHFSECILGTFKQAGAQKVWRIIHPCFDTLVTGWMPDACHIIRRGMDVIATLNKRQHLVNHIHYKDFSGNGAEPWSQMGAGKLDFHKIIEWLRDYTGWIICEDEAPVAKLPIKCRDIPPKNHQPRAHHEH
jgi:hypothetical protein